MMMIILLRGNQLYQLFESYNQEMIQQTKLYKKKHEEEEKENKKSNNQNSFEIKYNEIKEIFEKEHFKCISTSCFVQEVTYDEERKLILLTLKNVKIKKIFS